MLLQEVCAGTPLPGCRSRGSRSCLSCEADRSPEHARLTLEGPFLEAEEAARRGYVIQGGLGPRPCVSVEQQAHAVLHRTTFMPAVAAVGADEPGIAARSDPADTDLREHEPEAMTALHRHSRTSRTYLRWGSPDWLHEIARPCSDP